MNKRILAVLMALLMVAVGSVAMAADQITITKTYNSETGVIPNDSIKFTAKNTKFTDASGNEGSVTGDDVEKTLTVTSEKGTTKNYNVIFDFSSVTFTAPGIYEYTVSESSSTPVQGVDYSDTVKFNVLVGYKEKTNELEVQNVQMSEKVGDVKKGGITNTLAASTDQNALTITKEITGNMGTLTDTFNVNVTVTAENGKVLSGLDEIKVNNETVKAANGTYPITVAHGKSYVVTGIPTGAKIQIVETNQIGKTDMNQYTATYKNGTEAVAGTAKTLAIENDRTSTIDTGVNMDVLPYIMMMAIVAAAAVIFLMKKRVHD